MTPELPEGQPKSTDRRFIGIMVGVLAVIVLVLFGFALVTGLPGPPQGSVDKSDAPPEDVSRARP